MWHHACRNYVFNNLVYLSMGAEEEKTNTCGTICLKYLLFTFNLIFWVSETVCVRVRERESTCLHVSKIVIT